MKFEQHGNHHHVSGHIGIRQFLIALFLAIFFLMAIGFVIGRVTACEATAVTPNIVTGIAGCQRWGDGVASHYGPGDGVAMNFCTWEVRHSTGCGTVTIRSHDTGLVATVPVVDFCDCYTGTPDERIVDLQYGVLAALGLDPSAGLYPVTVWREGVDAPGQSGRTALAPALPDTALSLDIAADGEWWEWLVLAALAGLCFAVGEDIGHWIGRWINGRRR